jgi:glycine oxidase
MLLNANKLKERQIKIVLQRNSDILIAGAGIIGLSLALELHSRRARVTVLERDAALSHASTAAAGMLAADDPHNPSALHPLSQYSLGLYPNFLARIESLSGIHVPIQTEATIQYLPDGSTLRLAEQSLDPRQLAAALLAAVRATSIDLREHTELQVTEDWPRGRTVFTRTGEQLRVQSVVFATGAWAQTRPLHLRNYNLSVIPIKGQMLRLQIPKDLSLREVHRSEHIYIVPRTSGPQAGTALIGATLETTGFDTTTNPDDLAALRARAAALLPAFASETQSPVIESWAGLRPATPDHLPIFGQDSCPNEFLALGHFRNGILLAPATAAILADLIEGKQPTIDLAAFSPTRFNP